jgi:uncharacterized membrane protein
LLQTLEYIVLAIVVYFVIGFVFSALLMWQFSRAEKRGAYIGSGGLGWILMIFLAWPVTVPCLIYLSISESLKRRRWERERQAQIARDQAMLEHYHDVIDSLPIDDWQMCRDMLESLPVTTLEEYQAAGLVEGAEDRLRWSTSVKSAWMQRYTAHTQA